jgi:hypothetical protein
VVGCRIGDENAKTRSCRVFGLSVEVSSTQYTKDQVWQPLLSLTTSPIVVLSLLLGPFVVMMHSQQGKAEGGGLLSYNGRGLGGRGHKLAFTSLCGFGTGC